VCHNGTHAGRENTGTTAPSQAIRRLQARIVATS
jgi:hypothetical protein